MSLDACVLRPRTHLPILSGIQPAEPSSLESDILLGQAWHSGTRPFLHGQLGELLDVPRERLKSRRLFASAARKILNDLSKLGIHAAQ